MMRRSFQLRTLSACIGLFGCASLANAAGFNLLEQNASGLGNAYAGSAAIADNASTIYFNPAGMSQLPGLQISAGANLIGPSFKFKNDGKSRGAYGISRVGGNGGDAGSFALVPNLHMTYQATDRIHVGLGISVPFGLKTEYDKDWVGRYHSQSFEIETININPSLSFKVSDTFSIGAGFNIQHIKATYEKAQNTAPLYQGIRTRLEAGMRNAIAQGDVATQQRLGFAQRALQNHCSQNDCNSLDAQTKTKIKNTAYGWNIGFLYTPSEDTRIGFSYRSRIKHKADGDTNVEYPAPTTGLLAQFGYSTSALGAPPHSRAYATVSLPDMAILSLYQRLDPKWELLADVSWTGWSSIPKLTIKTPDFPIQHSTTLYLKFKDAWRIAVGANYQLTDAWKLKTGIAWDQSPVQKATYRPASLPDKDRLWLSIGAQYKPSENTTIDVGYTYLQMLGKAKVNNVNNSDRLVFGHLSGKYKANGHIFGLQLSHRFF
ncbi:OmpP1/FadL family transporter [Pelistega ratti]|uniref:OmpP1/FadL family transporter n=1 Tax=Pelistega ratti TaxID=2652177 RepID=UPI001FA97149|nr:outer membrane protein transport protein [Pelistega ratti]